MGEGIMIDILANGGINAHANILILSPNSISYAIL